LAVGIFSHGIVLVLTDGLHRPKYTQKMALLDEVDKTESNLPFHNEIMSLSGYGATMQNQLSGLSTISGTSLLYSSVVEGELSFRDMTGIES
jgi:hypothetical protein